MIENIITQTNLYIEEMPKKERKKYGQFFTSKETAIYMAGLFNVDVNKEELSVLDAGAGSGILSCALVEVLQNKTNMKKVHLTCYETDSNIIEILKNNLEYVKNNSRITLKYEIITEDYITSQYLD